MGRRFDGVLCGFWGTKSGEGYIVFGAVGPLYAVAVMLFWWSCGSRLYRYGLGVSFGLLKKVDYEVCLFVDGGDGGCIDLGGSQFGNVFYSLAGCILPCGGNFDGFHGGRDQGL